MTADVTFFWLSVWILGACGGAGLVALLRNRSIPESETLAQIIAWANVAAGAAALLSLGRWGAAIAARSWIPSLGVSAVLGVDGLSVALALVLTIVVATALWAQRSSEPGESVRPEGWLAAEGAALGMFFARDMFLLLACFGALSLAITSISRRPARAAGVAAMGLFALTGLSAPIYRHVYEQTGFHSTDLSRWFELVLYPREQVTLFASASAALALVSLVLPAAVSQTPRRAHGVAYSTVGVVASYLLFRVVVPLSAGGAVSVASTGKWVGVLVAAFVALIGPSRPWLFLGYQALFVFGLLSLDPSGVAGAERLLIGSVAAFSAVALADTRATRRVFAALLSGLALAGVVIPAMGAGVAVGLVSIVAVVGLGYRLAETQPEVDGGLSSVPSRWVVAPLLVCSVSLLIGFGAIRDGLRTSAETLLRHVAREVER